MERVLCLVHGFISDSSCLNPIKKLFEEGIGKGIYSRIILIDLYDGNKGFNFDSDHNLSTPIFSNANYENLDDERYPSLTSKLKKDLESQLPEEGEIDFICHSTGGLVVRAYLKYGFAIEDIHENLGHFINGHYKVNKVIMLAVPNHGTILANRWFSRFSNSVVHLLYSINEGLEDIFKPDETEIPDMSEGEINQLRVGSTFLKRLNEGIECLPYIRWYTFRGEHNRFFLGNTIFSYWLFGLLPTFWPERANDEIVQAKSVPLRGADINHVNKWLNHSAFLDIDIEKSLNHIKSVKKQEFVEDAIIWFREELVKIVKTY